MFKEYSTSHPSVSLRMLQTVVTMPMKSPNGTRRRVMRGIMHDRVSRMISAVFRDSSASVCSRYSESMPDSLLTTLRTGSTVKPTGAMCTCMPASEGSDPAHALLSAGSAGCPDVSFLVVASHTRW